VKIKDRVDHLLQEPERKVKTGKVCVVTGHFTKRRSAGQKRKKEGTKKRHPVGKQRCTPRVPRESQKTKTMITNLVENARFTAGEKNYKKGIYRRPHKGF